jgi:TonB family protein
METISRSLLTFLLNSLWQIPLTAAVAALACRLMRNGPANHRNAVWVAALVAAVLLPLASVRTSKPTAKPQIAVSFPAGEVAAAKSALQSPTQAPSALSPAAASRTVSFAETTAAVLLGAYFLFVVFRLARLALASIRTVQIRRAAQNAAVPELIKRVWIRCQEAYGLTGVKLRFSSQVSGPVTAGQTIILPHSLLAEPSEDVLTTAIGNEMAHIARSDFACNLLYELLLLPVSFHPAAWLIRSGIERTREMACDELVTQRLIDAGVYARSIMSMASVMTVLPRPGCTLGVFDGDILEERIRRLVERPAANLKRARLLLVTALSGLTICAVVASSMALTARAQSAAHALMKQAEVAYNRGAYQEAAQQFENAVKIEPANLKARLLLANSLLRQYSPGTDAASPLVTGAREQYHEVLARDPGNKPATEGMLILLTYTKQFAEAHDWALKSIQADPTDKFAYYTAGFLDWVMSYPDYVSARAAAGMKPQDLGIIPDADLRLKVRTQHMAQIEDGLRMLQVALQLDPDYSDAMAYMNLLYRLEAGIIDSEAQSAELIATADSWVTKTLAAKRQQAPSPQQAAQALDVDGPVPASLLLPPPPPPPPPPPAGDGQPTATIPPGTIRVEGNEQQAKLVSQPPPVYPPQARQAGISGVVRLSVLIAKDGRVKNVEVVRGHPLLVPAAIDAVWKWVYQQTLLNGEPVEVSTSVTVNFQVVGQ